MKDYLPLITVLLEILKPNEQNRAIRLERKELRLLKKKIRIAERIYKDLTKEFKKDGFTQEETEMLDDLKSKILIKKLELAS